MLSSRGLLFFKKTIRWDTWNLKFGIYIRWSTFWNTYSSCTVEKIFSLKCHWNEAEIVQLLELTLFATFFANFLSFFAPFSNLVQFLPFHSITYMHRIWVDYTLIVKWKYSSQLLENNTPCLKMNVFISIFLTCFRKHLKYFYSIYDIVLTKKLCQKGNRALWLVEVANATVFYTGMDIFNVLCSSFMTLPVVNKAKPYSMV